METDSDQLVSSEFQPWHKPLLAVTSTAFLMPVVSAATPLLCRIGFGCQCIASLLYHRGQDYPCDKEHLRQDMRYVRDLDILLARGMTAYCVYQLAQNWNRSYRLSLLIVALIGFSYLLYLIDYADLYCITHSMWHITASLAALLIFQLASQGKTGFDNLR